MTTIRVGISHSADQLPYFVLRSQGFDRAFGLHLLDKLYIGGAATLDAIQKGQVDLAVSIGTVVVITAADNGLIPSTLTPVASLAVSDLQHPAMALLVSNSITSFKQLDGQLLATNSRNSLGAFMLAARLKKEGVSSYSLIEMDFANQGLAVAGGNVIGATLLEPYLTQSLRRGDGHILDWLTGRPPFERMPYTMVAFRSAFLKDNPDAVRRFLLAHLQAVLWMRKHEKEARSILGKALDIDEDVAQKMYLPEWPTDARNDPDLLLSLEREMRALGMIRTLPPPQQLYDETILEGVLGKGR